MKRKTPYYIKVAYLLTLQLITTLADDVDISNSQIPFTHTNKGWNLLPGLVSCYEINVLTHLATSSDS